MSAIFMQVLLVDTASLNQSRGNLARAGHTAASYVRTLEELGRPVPATGEVYGGQWRQRVPKSLHAALARRAEREGVSLNMLVTTMPAEGIGRRNALEPGK